MRRLLAAVGIAALLAGVGLVSTPKQAAALNCGTMYAINSQVQSYQVFDLDQGVWATVKFTIFEYSDSGYNAGCRQIQVLDQITDYNIHVGWSPAMSVNLEYRNTFWTRYWTNNVYVYRQPSSTWYQVGFSSNPYYIDPSGANLSTPLGISARANTPTAEVDDWCGEGSEGPDSDGTFTSYDYYTGLSPICQGGDPSVTESH